MPIKNVSAADNIKYNFIAYLKEQKKMLIVAGILSAICFLLLKFFFPIPDFFVDSLNYILWTKFDSTVQFRPTGYSSFLKLIHSNFSESATGTVFVQYLLFLLSSLFCFFSADYLFGLPRKLKWVLFLLVILNPVLILQTNLISSDSVFCSLTIFWITACLWIIRRHNWWALVLQVVFLYFSFQIRYTALFFPLIAIIAFLASTAKILYKALGIALTVFVIYGAIDRQMDAVESGTGVRVFSGFSGWQMANNVLYYYKKINVNTNDFPTEETKFIDRVVKTYIDSVPKTDSIGSLYLWDKKSPLKVYVYILIEKKHLKYFPLWFAVSIPYNEYAWFIIKSDPMAFIKYFILPNTQNFFYPNPEVLLNYNSTHVALDTDAMKWFHYTSKTLSCRYPSLQKNIISVYPALSLLLNVFNIAAILIFLFRLVPAWRKTAGYIKGLFITWSMFYFTYASFSIFATLVTLRYIDPIYVLGFIIPFILLGYNNKEAQNQAAEHIPATNSNPEKTTVSIPSSVKKTGKTGKKNR